MSSTIETGHAKNIANANALIDLIQQVETSYVPTSAQIAKTNLQQLYTDAFQAQSVVNNLIAPYSKAVEVREKSFAEINPIITTVLKLYKVTDGVSKEDYERLVAISRKLKGEKKYVAKGTTEDPDKRTRSTSQMSYDQRTNNFEQFIALLENTPNYNPNEVAYKVAALKAHRTQMLADTNQVLTTHNDLTTARTNRNLILYQNTANLVDTFNLAKAYFLAIVPNKTPQYNTGVKLVFRKATPNAK